MKILANDGMDQAAVLELQAYGYTVDTNHYTGTDLEEQIQIVDAIIIRSATKIRKQLIDVATKTKTLKLIIRAGVGIDNIDYIYAEEQGIKVRNTPNASSDAVAELTLAHMFSLTRNLYHSNQTMRKGQWLKKQYVGIELAGKTVGLVGFGRIAKSVAQKAHALGMTIQYTDFIGDQHVEYATHVSMVTLLKTSDFISLHIPYDATKGPTIGEAEFAKMKPGMYLINIARGGVVDETALLEALNTGIVYKAALDVFEQEPTSNKALYTHEHISLSPHIGASTIEAQERIGKEVIEVLKNTLPL